MGLVERLFGRSAQGAPAVPPIAPTVGWESVPWIDARSVMGVSAVWRCVTIIADALGDMPWQEWRGDKELPPSRLVINPVSSEWGTRRDWTRLCASTMALYNVVYLLHTGGKDAEGAPWSLLPLPPSMIQPAGRLDPWGVMRPTEYRIGGYGEAIPAEYVTVIRRMPLPGVTDELSGLLQIARRQFTAYVAADLHMSRYWTAGGPVNTVLTTEADIDDTLAVEIGQRWVDRRALGAEWPAVLGYGLHRDTAGEPDPTSASGTEARREMTADVGRHFGIPTRILNAPAGDSETYSNVENDAIDLWRYSLRGYAGPLEDAVSVNLPGSAITGRRMRLDPSALLQGNLTDRAAAWSALVSNGIAEADEARVRGFGLSARGATQAPADPQPSTSVEVSTAEVPA